MTNTDNKALAERIERIIEQVGRENSIDGMDGDTWDRMLVRAALTREPSAPSAVNIDAMVDRFLAWPVPKDFAPDAGIQFNSSAHPNGWPVGTNLLTAAQAKAMFEHVLAGTTPSAQCQTCNGHGVIDTSSGQTADNYCPDSMDRPDCTPSAQVSGGWSGWACQYPGKMPRLYGAREIAELNWYPAEGARLIRLVEAESIGCDFAAQPQGGQGA